MKIIKKNWKKFHFPYVPRWVVLSFRVSGLALITPFNIWRMRNDFDEFKNLHNILEHENPF